MMEPGKKPIVVVGSINIDLVASAASIPLAGQTVTGSDFQVHPGGKGANQAVAAARLGYPVHMIGRLGDDVFGAQLRSHLESAGATAYQSLSSEPQPLISSSAKSSAFVHKYGHGLGRPQLGMKWEVAKGMLLGPEGLLRPVDSGVIEPAHEYGLDAVKDNRVSPCASQEHEKEFRDKKASLTSGKLSVWISRIRVVAGLDVHKEPLPHVSPG